MPGGFPQPYRGQPRPKFLRPKKQIRNLQKENWQDIFSIIRIFLFFGLIFGTVIGFLSSNFNNGDRFGVIVIGVLIILFCTIVITIGMKSINKFRKGYDVDVSGEAKKDDNEELE